MTAPLAPAAYNLAVLILAAGQSRRMGRPKMLLPWHDTTVLGHLLARWQELYPAQLTVIAAAGDTLLTRELDRLGLPTADRIENPSPETGMFSSVQWAARWPGWKPGLTHWAVVLGDQPHLARETLESMLAWSRRHPAMVCQPTFQGHRRHPVLLPGAIFLKAAKSPAATLKEFLADVPASYCALGDAGLGLDLDTPADYDDALRRYPGSAGPR